MTPEEIDVLKTKGMLRSPFTPLHPTLKACKCGMIGTKTQFYSHMDQWGKLYEESKLPNFWKDHGEVPINADDPRTQLSAQLAVMVERQKKQQKLIDEL